MPLKSNSYIQQPRVQVRVGHVTSHSPSQLGIDKAKGFIFVGYNLTQTNQRIIVLTNNDVSISVKIVVYHFLSNMAVQVRPKLTMFATSTLNWASPMRGHPQCGYTPPRGRNCYIHRQVGIPKWRASPDGGIHLRGVGITNSNVRWTSPMWGVPPCRHPPRGVGVILSLLIQTTYSFVFDREKSGFHFGLAN